MDADTGSVRRDITVARSTTGGPIRDTRKCKTQTFVCPFPHPLAEATDSLTIDWERGENIFLFPPPRILHQVVSKLTQFRGHGVLVAPDSPHAPWYGGVNNRAAKKRTLENAIFQRVQGKDWWTPPPSYLNLTAFSF